MKKHINLLNTICLVMLCIPVLSRANGDDIEKKKNISKTYSVSSSDQLDITNSFGEVVINTWDKSEIKVDVEITAEASSEERAQSLIDNIDVKENRSGNTISFKTNVESNDNGSRKNKDGNRKFEIN